MGNEIEKQNKGIASLSPEERADKSYECYNLYIKGKNYTQISKSTGMAIPAVKKLITEHAVTIEKYRPETRTVAESQYRKLIDHFWGVIERAQDPDQPNVSPLVEAKAMEGLIQAQTRLDKFYGHESPQLHVHGDMKTAAELVREAQNFNSDDDAVNKFTEEEDYIDMEEENNDG